MSDKKPKLVVIDGNAIIHRAWHALPQTLRTAMPQTPPDRGGIFRTEPFASG